MLGWMGWTAVISGVAAGVVVVRWRRTAPDVFGRPPPKPWWGAGSLAVLCAVTGAFAVRDHLRESRLSEVSSSLAGRSVRVNCQSYAGAFVDANAEGGYVRWQADGRPEPETTLKADVCRSLGRYGKGDAHPSISEIVAVHTVTHEAMHMAGHKNEAVTECAAVQRDAETARLLGASADEADRLAREYWTVVYPRMPDDYRTGECSPGGPLDESLPDAPWKQR